MTNKLARELYFAFIYSRIKFGIEVYGRCSAQKTNKVQVMQNKLLKLLLRKHRMTPTDEIHKKTWIYWRSVTYMNVMYLHLLTI